MKQTGSPASGNFQASREDGPHAILPKYRLLQTVTIIMKKMFSVLWKNLVILSTPTVSTPTMVGGWGAQRPFWERDSYYIPENWVEGTEFHLEVTVGCCTQAQRWARIWCVGKIERQLVSMELSVLGHVADTRLAWLTGDGGRCLVGHARRLDFLL